MATIHEKINAKGNAQKLYIGYNEPISRLQKLIIMGYPYIYKFNPEHCIGLHGPLDLVYYTKPAYYATKYKKRIARKYFNGLLKKIK